MKLKAAIVALALVLSGSAFAASSVEGLRSQASQARAQLLSVRSEQMSKRTELNQLSSRIEALKAQSKGKLNGGSELDTALKASQELSGSLTTLAQTVSVRETELEALNLSLLEALGQEQERLRADFNRQSTSAGRKSVLQSMNALKAEREQLRAALPASKVPALPSISPSDDPQELLEQADALRDNEDKVRRELKALEKRINEVKSEKELARQMGTLAAEENIFDDNDRKLRITRQTLEAGGVGGTQNAKTTDVTTSVGPPPSKSGPQSASVNDPGAFDSDRTESATPPPGGFGAPPGKQSDGTTATGNSTVRTQTGSDSRVQVGGGLKIAGGDDDDLEELEVQRLKLQGLAGELKAKANELEKQAHQLK